MNQKLPCANGYRIKLHALKQNHSTAYAPSSFGEKSLTNLYELVEAVSDVIGPGEKKLIGRVVMQIFNDHSAAFECAR